MKTLEFERLQRGTYKAFLHAGGYSIPVTEEVLQELKELVSSPPELFLRAVAEKVGYNRYLRELIEEAARNGGEADALSKALKEDLLRI